MAEQSSQRTKKHKHTNRLASEHSPYLLQHAHNPVDWYPWGEEAFADARKRDVPIFLSTLVIGCHVMEVESFENEEVARLLNDWFVSIKVDREERPDVDKDLQNGKYQNALEFPCGKKPMMVMSLRY
nr:spermatogenesis-associated protein 20 [Ipomoea batatas]